MVLASFWMVLFVFRARALGALLPQPRVIVTALGLRASLGKPAWCAVPLNTLEPKTTERTLAIVVLVVIVVIVILKI